MLPPATLALTAEVDGDAVATACVERARLPEDVSRSVIREAGLVGTLFHPIDDGPRPGVILLGGSEGGLHELDAALLANHGFAVLALAYFGAEGLPSHLVEIPLEYFEAAIGFLRAHPAIQGGPVGLIGGSRGGEAALNIGATFEGVGAVVSTVGSGVTTQGIGPGSDLLEIAGTPVPSWTLRGRPLPYLRNRITPELRQQVATRAAVELAVVFEPGMADPSEVEACAIPVERIGAPVLLVSAGLDRMWPCGPMSEVAARRLAAGGRPHEHLHFADAGHPIAPPPFGPTTELTSPGPGVMFAMGGTPEANAAARAAAWRRSIEFLSERLAP
jgi:dienelactone hydrolase